MSELIARSVLFGNPQRAFPQISPDGKRLFYLAPHPDSGVLNVWMQTMGQGDARPVTHDTARPVRIYALPYNNRHLIYAQDAGGDENWRLFLVDLDAPDAPARDVTPFEKTVSSILAVSPDHPDTALVTCNKREPTLFDVYALSLPGGELELRAENPGDVVSWLADADLQIRACTARTPDGFSFDLRVRETMDAAWQTLLTWGPDDQGGPRAFRRDGALYLLSNVNADTIGLRLLDITTRAQMTLVERANCDVAGVMVNPQTRVAEAIAFNRARQEWHVLDEGVQSDFDALAAFRPGEEFSPVSRDLADTVWLVEFVADDGPVRYFSFDRQTKTPTLLFSNRPELESQPLATMTPVEIPSRDGFSLPSYLTLPVGVEPKNLPMVLNVHGGPWGRDSWGLDVEAQWLANRGYAVLQVNYRGSAGFGKDFYNAAKKEFAGKMHDDLIDAVQWAIDNGYAAKEKIAIYGGSYGGYATLVGMTFTPDTFACGVDLVGPSSLVSLIESFPPYWKPFLAKTWYAFVGDPSDPEQRKDLEARSPLNKIDEIRKPLLIAQGANDPRVTQPESDAIVAKMRAAGLPVTYLLFPDEGHGFARPENRMKFYAAAEAFLGEHLGGACEPAHDGEEPPMA